MYILIANYKRRLDTKLNSATSHLPKAIKRYTASIPNLSKFVVTSNV